MSENSGGDPERKPTPLQDTLLETNLQAVPGGINPQPDPPAWLDQT